MALPVQLVVEGSERKRWRVATPLSYWRGLKSATRKRRALDEVSGAIHDLWFDLDAVVFDSGRETLRIPLSEAKGGPICKVLTLLNVRSFSYHDTESVGSYDVNRLRIDRRTGDILLECNIPLVLRISTDAEFCVEVAKPSERT